MSVQLFTNRKSASEPSGLDLKATLIVLITAAALVAMVFQPVISVVAIVAVLALSYSLQRPALVAYAILGFLWVNDILSDFDPFGRYTAWKDALLFLIVVGWLARTLLQRRPLVYPSEVRAPYLILVALYLVMVIQTPVFLQGVLGLKATIWYATFFVLMRDIIQTRRDARTLFLVIMFATLCLGIYNLWRVQLPWGSFPPRRDGRITSGLLQAHWSGSAYLLPYGVLLGIGLISEFRGWRKWLINIALIGGGAGFIVTYLRANYAAMFLAMLAMAIVSRRIGQFGKLLVVAGIAGIIVQSSLQVDVSDRVGSSLDSNDESRQVRTAETVDLTLPWVLKHPLGGGTGLYSAAASASVWASSSSDDMHWVMPNAIHNNFMVVAIEVGWFGLIVWIWWLVATMRASLRLYQNAHDEFFKAYGLGLFGITVFFFFMQPFQPMLVAPLTPVMYWPLMGMIPVLEHLDAKTKAASEAAALPEPALPAAAPA